MMKAEASRWIKECAYCSRAVEDQEAYNDLAPSGPVVFYAPSPARPGRSLPVLQVVCEECQGVRARFALDGLGSVIDAGLFLQEAVAAL